MIFKEKKIVLKDGSEALFKTPSRDDAEGMLEYIRKACSETDFLARYPEEYDISVEEEMEWIGRWIESDNILSISCYIDGKIAGNCVLTFHTMIKSAHRAEVAIAIIKKHWGKGIASAMFKEMISAAKERGCEIMELTVVEGNTRAENLYRGFGFERTGEKPQAFKLKDGRYLSEISMQKYLTETD